MIQQVWISNLNWLKYPIFSQGFALITEHDLFCLLWVDDRNTGLFSCLNLKLKYILNLQVYFGWLNVQHWKSVYCKYNESNKAAFMGQS